MSNVLDVDIAMTRGAVALEVKLVVPGGVTVLVGPSGAGKSTLLSVIAGLVDPTRGTIVLAGEVWFESNSTVNLPPELRRVGFVFQSPALFPHLTVLENVGYGLPRNLTAAQRRARVAGLLARFRVTDLAERKPDRLSGGEAQRVALARAIAREPSVLLLDEPFSGLDALLRDALAAEVAKCARELSIPTLVVTHDREDARRLDGNVVRLASGKIVSDSATLRVDSPSPAS
ncbi:MAG: ATP-binding cassette domain-containing protein [Polyangiaceae bacterium]